MKGTMKLAMFSILALVFAVLGTWCVFFMPLALICLGLGIYELWKRDDVVCIQTRERWNVWVNGEVMNSGLTEEEADVMADAYLKAGFFDVEIGLDGK